ncbi:hypothetical protein Ddye_011454 [Dipteronia dyeriana]|uniref:Polygalacturonase n=1 Tax=Dipteronia dyeriana TaxID=168575 RepID=A0AAE0CI70_9ROSI|nr:hypothetical protein Ddye_011454 [Dipteronia dyeriana]
MSMVRLGSSMEEPCEVPRNYNAVNVIQMGAVGDGETDDSQAFIRAWESVCGATTKAPTLYIPDKKTFLLKPLKFRGPCKSPVIYVLVQGNLVALAEIKEWEDEDTEHWIVFSDVNGLSVTGNGQIDGEGGNWWEQADKRKDYIRPTALEFSNCNNLQLSGLTHIDSPSNHISINGCNGVTISNLHITAPDSSPNTDGIDISRSLFVHIHDCYIGTGDDCVAIGGGSSNITIDRVSCGPGHGISVGSLGKDGKSETVEDVLVKDCHFNGTTNGARIKTWQGGSGYARRISFEGITLDAVANPIIIDQYYCNKDHDCKNQTEAVAVSDVSFIGVRGTSTTEEAIQFSCSESVACANIFVSDIHITSSVPGEITRASCLDAHGSVSGPSVPPLDCLKQ